MSLRLNWCSNDAAKYAVEHWHYSKRLPAPKLITIGVWEFEKYIGCVIFSRGNNNNIGNPYTLNQNEVCELTRIALNSHVSHVTKILSIAIKMLRSHHTDLKLIISYADPVEGHNGTIYQAANWVYVGGSGKDVKYIDKTGKAHHSRTVSESGFKKQFGVYKRVVKPSECKKILLPPKHKYLYPLTDDMRSKIEPLRKPYPKRASVVHTVEQPAYQPEEGGSIPTVTHTVI